MHMYSSLYIDEWRLTEQTNVWGIGLVLWTILANHTSLHQPSWIGNAQHEDTHFPIKDDFVRDGWSQQILSLVRDCLQYDVDARPMFDDMLTRIGAAVAVDDNAAGDGKELNPASDMREGNASKPEKSNNTPHFREDRYQIGMTAQLALGKAL